ncbi:glycosyltransferase [Mucilaginibacter sp. CSA2-8R]|uniref:glycosyltransferase family 2 protein n=1 Tax=Mucilaginibacter sp. CSA2-8R TaxID=3141542 RepID=UPI00315D580E
MAILSIIIPVYNKEQYIDGCLTSILNQTFTDFELILVDDGSTDESQAVCRRFAEKDNRIILITQPNGGVSAARNVGLSKASGKYIGFIDSDDAIEADMYELLIHNAEQYEADISICRLKTIFPDKTVAPAEQVGVKIYQHEQALSLFLKGELDMSANNKIYKAELAKQILFNGHVYEDILYLSKAFLKAQKSVFENVVKYHYIVRDNSVSVKQFNARYLETIAVSAQIVKMVKAKAPDCLPEAQAFDVTANLSLLNLLLLAGTEVYPQAYQQVITTLNTYNQFIKHNPAVRKKHELAYRLFSLSPWLYTKAMHAYSMLTGAETTKRTKKKSLKVNEVG